MCSNHRAVASHVDVASVSQSKFCSFLLYKAPIPAFPVHPHSCGSNASTYCNFICSSIERVVPSPLLMSSQLAADIPFYYILPSSVPPFHPLTSSDGNCWTSLLGAFLHLLAHHLSYTNDINSAISHHCSLGKVSRWHCALSPLCHSCLESASQQHPHTTTIFCHVSHKTLFYHNTYEHLTAARQL